MTFIRLRNDARQVTLRHGVFYYRMYAGHDELRFTSDSMDTDRMRRKAFNLDSISNLSLGRPRVAARILGYIGFSHLL